VAHQKIALAYRGAGDLNRATRYIDVALTKRASDTPMQRVRLTTAHAHILLSDKVTRDNGLDLLDSAAHIADQFNLGHQLTSVRTIRRVFDHPAGYQNGNRRRAGD
jgi:hypothetical protein